MDGEDDASSLAPTMSAPLSLLGTSTPAVRVAAENSRGERASAAEETTVGAESASAAASAAATDLDVELELEDAKADEEEDDDDEREGDAKVNRTRGFVAEPCCEEETAGAIVAAAAIEEAFVLTFGFDAATTSPVTITKRATTGAAVDGPRPVTSVPSYACPCACPYAACPSS